MGGPSFLLLPDADHVLYAVVLFSALRVIPAVDRADEIACDATDAVEFWFVQLPIDYKIIAGPVFRDRHYKDGILVMFAAKFCSKLIEPRLL